ncbi:hypothetical protein FDH38_gp022 [Dinoroseobacter phage vB_DshS-R5C]|uniref:Uncharacterized protein n=1 Tax=Dinoroseobacter phage vB_DshS-R5C TaxID=1965368 RepID=A0A1V0DY38_9CAUD|nr:hypothetical protein FDH38_gp022 [Dinoroseobacter phage vB_DshS-R5C]ARB06076.1 hypothetical protein vBDshSR5C_22 [Dinoroseobacter phage vB_DshS-R5C]
MVDIEQPQIDIDLTMPFRRAMIEAFADLIMSQRDLRFAIVLEILSRDDVMADMIAEEFGERALTSSEDDAWHDIMADALEELRNTPGGRGEVFHDDYDDEPGLED